MSVLAGSAKSRSSVRWRPDTVPHRCTPDGFYRPTPSRAAGSTSASSGTTERSPKRRHPLRHLYPVSLRDRRGKGASVRQGGWEVMGTFGASEGAIAGPEARPTPNDHRQGGEQH